MTTREGISSTANPDEARSEGDTEREGRQDRERRKARRVPKEVAAGGSRLKSTDGGIVPRGKGLLTDSGPSASKFNQGKKEKERGSHQDDRKTKGWNDLKKCLKQGSCAQAPAVELVPQKKDHTHELGPGAVAERPTSQSHLHRNPDQGPSRWDEQGQDR